MTGRCRRSEVQQDMATAVERLAAAAGHLAPSAPSGVGVDVDGSVALAGQRRATTWRLALQRAPLADRRASRPLPGTGSRSRPARATPTLDSRPAPTTTADAEDAAGNVSGASAQVTAVVSADLPPTVSMTAPAAGATVSGTVSVTAGASDDIGVAGVQFRLGAATSGARTPRRPIPSPGTRRASATAATRSRPSPATAPARPPPRRPITVTVNNAAPTAGLVAAYGFNAGSGSTAADSSAAGNTGSVSGATWNAAGRYGSALSFDGVNDSVTTPDASSLDLTNAMTLEAWVRPSALGGWRTVVFKERPADRLRAVRRSGRLAAARTGVHRLGAERDRDLGASAECVDASGDDL